MTNNKYFVFMTVAFAFVLGGAALAASKGSPAFQGSISVKGKSKSEYSALAKISIQDAITSATQSGHGKAIEAALDDEDGFLVYEVDVLMPDQSRKEILIDAGDGKVLLTKDKKGKKSKDDDDEDED